jgi:hypothetical protein
VASVPFTAAHNPLAWIATHAWAYPLLEVVHIVGIALLLGSPVLLELRVWGLGAALPLQPLAKLALPVTLAGFALAAASGSRLHVPRGEKGVAVLRAEYHWAGGKAYGLRSSPA